MSELNRILAAHPLSGELPYSKIKFARFNDLTPLYTVGKDPIARSARNSLAVALERFGGACFHCPKELPPGKMSHERTRDHVRARTAGGSDYLHNLVISCGDCNRGKGPDDIVKFRPRSGSKYLKALDEHLVRCIKQLAQG